MLTLDATQKAPLALDDDGTIRLAGSRVTLDTVVRQFKQGATAEQIQEDFPSLELRDVYGAIAYYLQHVAEVDEYLRSQSEAAARSRRDIESTQDSGELRARLRQRRATALK